MSRTRIWAAGLAIVIGLASCGSSDSDDPTTGLSDRDAIQQAAENYFLLDQTPDPDAYCTSYIALEIDEQPSHGDLTEAAERTESECRRGFEHYAEQIGKTGWPQAEIERIQIDKSDRAHVYATWVERGRQTSRNAPVGKVAEGDWRVLNAGYD